MLNFSKSLFKIDNKFVFSSTTSLVSSSITKAFLTCLLVLLVFEAFISSINWVLFLELTLVIPRFLHSANNSDLFILFNSISLFIMIYLIYYLNNIINQFYYLNQHFIISFYFISFRLILSLISISSSNKIGSDPLE